MFGIKKKIRFNKANDFLYKKIEEFFFPLQKALLTKEAANFQLSDKAVAAILYEFSFFFIYTLHTTEQYKNDEYLDDLLKRFSSFFKPPLKLEMNEYSKRFSGIDEVMNLVMTNARNSGGVGSAIVSYILLNLPDSILNEIIITRNDELERIFGVEVEDEKNNDIFVYLPMLTGMLFGEMIIRFTKDAENYFQKYKIAPTETL